MLHPKVEWNTTYVLHDERPVFVLQLVRARVLEQRHRDGVVVRHRPPDVALQRVNHVRLPRMRRGGDTPRAACPHNRQVGGAPVGKVGALV